MSPDRLPGENSAQSAAPPAAVQPEVSPSGTQVSAGAASVADSTRRDNVPSLLASEPPPSFETSSTPIYILLALLVVFALIAATGIVVGAPRLLQAITAASQNLDFSAAKKTNNGSSGSASRRPGNSAASSAAQQQAEEMLAKAVAGDVTARDTILQDPGRWTGQAHRSQRMYQLIDQAINGNDMQVRAAGLVMQLEIDGVTLDDRGFEWLSRCLNDPKNRAWALWMLGDIGNRGVHPEQAEKLMAGFLSSSDVQNRNNAVNGLAILGTDETVPLLLDRFRNDPSPMVQESGARGLAASGMYTHQQRVRAAGTLVGWIGDTQLTPAQNAWLLHALRDISGKNFGADAASWRQWLAEASAGQ